MDRMRSIEYFLAAAEEGSFAGAARRLEVSVPAVLKGVAALETHLSARLFERSPRGLALTAIGDAYLEACRPLLAELDALDESIGRSARGPAGVLVVATNPQIAQHVLLPSLPRFHALHPDIHVDLRAIHRLTDADAETADVFVVHGWPELPDMVHRRLGHAKTLIVAPPEYWARHGLPRHPSDLARHACLMLRNPSGTLLDLWEFERDGARVSVKAGGWFSSNNREAVLDLVLAGEGVGRFSQVCTVGHLRSGRLVPALTDWEVVNGPPLNLLYRAAHRRTPRVRLFIDHLAALLRDIEADATLTQQQVPMDLPSWYRRGYGRASSILKARG